MPTSGDTLLRLLRKLSPTPSVTPRVLGVDDWAICRGQRYGTILYDLERHCVVDLLPDRSSDSFADWLKSRPGIEIISRDRSEIYIRGATAGAPKAVQVTDRWHLIKNLSDAIVRILDRYGPDVRSAARAPADSDSDRSLRHVQEIDSAVKPRPQSAQLQLVEQHRKSRLRRYKEIRRMHEQGLSFRTIARRTGMNFRTVQRYAEAATFPERQQRQCRRGTDSFDGFLRRRWEEGCRNAKQLTRELVGRGFKGSYYMVRHHVRGWRQSGGARDVDNSPMSRRHRMTSRQAAWILLRSPEERNEFERAFATALCDRCPPVATVHRLAREFRAMMKNQDAAELGPWLARVETTELKGFGKGIAAHEASVRAAFELPWSNGQTEGQVNRLKTLKRQMYGRASIDLLRTRMLAEQTVYEVTP